MWFLAALASGKLRSIYRSYRHSDTWGQTWSDVSEKNLIIRSHRLATSAALAKNNFLVLTGLYGNREATVLFSFFRSLSSLYLDVTSVFMVTKP